jgi:hypothetical protein
LIDAVTNFPAQLLLEQIKAVEAERDALLDAEQTKVSARR